MELFNIGILEFLFILLLAFIVLGPKKAVKIAGEVGSWIRNFLDSQIWKDIKETSRDIRDIPRKIADDAEIQRTLEDIDDLIHNKKDMPANNEARSKDDAFENKQEFQDHP